jgi:hypothetical protein
MPDTIMWFGTSCVTLLSKKHGAAPFDIALRAELKLHATQPAAWQQACWHKASDVTSSISSEPVTVPTTSRDANRLNGTPSQACTVAELVGEGVAVIEDVELGEVLPLLAELGDTLLLLDVDGEGDNEWEGVGDGGGEDHARTTKPSD